MNPANVILNGSLLVATPLALLAGLVSFLSPCVLPLVPGYLGYVSGMAGKSVTSADGKPVPVMRSRVLTGTALFVLGFSLVFISFGSVFGLAGQLFYGTNAQIMQRVLGVIIVLLGFVMIGQFGWMQRTFKPSFSVRAGLIGAPLLGVAFGLGWTPCIGPTLGSVLALTLDAGQAGRGVILTIAYSIGLGLPFVLLAAGFAWATKSVAFVRKNIRAFNIAGGVLLMILGLMMVSGLWTNFIEYIQVVNSGFIPSI